MEIPIDVCLPSCKNRFGPETERSCIGKRFKIRSISQRWMKSLYLFLRMKASSLIHSSVDIYKSVCVGIGRRKVFGFLFCTEKRTMCARATERERERERRRRRRRNWVNRIEIQNGIKLRSRL